MSATLYKCDSCNAEFASLQELDSHKRNANHSGTQNLNK